MKSTTLHIAYLLESTALCGGVKIVFDHTEGLSKKGLSVTIFSKEEKPSWHECAGVEFIKINAEFSAIHQKLLTYDIVIATSYTQVLELYDLVNNLIHFSQGYEKDYPFWEKEGRLIDEAYALPIPKITISKRVASIIKERFKLPVYYIPQGIAIDRFGKKDNSGIIKKIIVVGTWENEIKGIRYALEGFSVAKKINPQISLVRVSTLPMSNDEAAVYPANEYYTAVAPDMMPDIYNKCGLAVVPSLEGEGFGLPALEAMAAELPCILTKIHSFLSLDDTKDYAYFVSPSSSEEIANAIINLTQQPDLSIKLAKRARHVAQNYKIEKTSAKLIDSLNEIKGNLKTVDLSHKKIDMVFFEKRIKSLSMEESLLLKQSKETFSGNSKMIIININESHTVTAEDILQKTEADFIGICIDNTAYHSTNWTKPLLEALNNGFELASAVCSDTFNIEMPYYTPLTLDITAKYLKEKYRGQHITDITIPALSFLIKRSALSKLSKDTPAAELPHKLKSCLVPASLIHRFGDYYSSKRDDLLPFIPCGIKKVLDVGCARGYLGELIKKERFCTVYGVELNPEIAKEAEKKVDEVFCMNIETEDLPFDNELDVIVFADLLEHLTDPWSMLKKALKWLKSDGIVIASMPNTAHYSIIHDLLHGRWDYIPFGLLCITHLRFFTKKSIESMFNEAGFSILTLKHQAWPEYLLSEIKNQLSEVINIVNIPDEVFYPGYYVVAKKQGNKLSLYNTPKDWTLGYLVDNKACRNSEQDGKEEWKRGTLR